MTLRNLLAVSAFALLAACGQAADTSSAGGASAADAAVEVKAPAGVYVLDPTHAALLWSFQHNGISNYTGRFGKLDARLTLDPANLSASSISVTIDPASVSVPYPGDYKGTHAQSPYANWEQDIAQNPNYLNAGAFPQITFTSTQVTQTGPRTADVTGDLTFLGVTKPVTLKATFNGELESHPFMGVPAVGFAAEGSFKRSDFGHAVQIVGDEVTIRFDGEFVRQAD